MKKKGNFKKGLFTALCSVSLLGIISILSYVIITALPPKTVHNEKVNSAASTISEPEEPPFLETTATVISTGDIMVHEPQLYGAYVPSTKSYDFSAFFKEVAPYFKKADLSIANLEVTFGSEESGAYSGYPVFNCPDTLADAIKESGLNLILTANNHSYDTGLFGLTRTASVLKEKGIEFTGTKETEADPSYIVKTVNNINIGIVDYTYETTGADSPEGKKYLNGIPLKEEANALVNSFNYNKIEDFYRDAEEKITAMKNDGAEFIVFYMHWGNEYQTEENTHQNAIAQELSNLGVNMIIGGHPHVIQPVELITSEDGQNSTVCLYSLGNAVSNQRQERMEDCPSGHTEDGMLFEYTLRKTENGVILESLDIIPTWVDKYPGGSGYLYTIYPLEKRDDAGEKYGLSSALSERAGRSYDRTKKIVAEGLTACQKDIGCDITFKKEK